MMKYSRLQIAYTTVLWAILVAGVSLLLVQSNTAGICLVGIGLLMGALRIAYAWKLRDRNNAGGEDDV